MTDVFDEHFFEQVGRLYGRVILELKGEGTMTMSISSQRNRYITFEWTSKDNNQKEFSLAHHVSFQCLAEEPLDLPGLAKSIARQMLRGVVNLQKYRY